MPSKLWKRYPSDYTEEELRAQARELESAVTIPANVEIEADHRVLDLGEVEKLLRQLRTSSSRTVAAARTRGTAMPRETSASP